MLNLLPDIDVSRSVISLELEAAARSCICSLDESSSVYYFPSLEPRLLHDRHKGNGIDKRFPRFYRF